MPGLVWPLVVRDGATPAFLRVAAAGDKAATAAGRAQAKVATAGAKMSAVGATMSRRLTLPLLAVGAASVKAATDFNASMTRIQTQAGASAKDVQVLTKQVLGMKDAQFGPNALAGALYHLKSVGLANIPAMKALKASQDLAAVGGANLGDTTNALAGAWRSGIKGAGSFAHTAATVNAIIGAGNMTLADFTEGLSTGILPAARTFGVSLQSIGAALSVFTDEGVPANVALTRMRMTLSLLGAPTAKATKLLDGIGLSSTQLAKDMRSGPNGLLNAVSDLKDHLAGLSKVQVAQFLSQAFGGGRSSSAIMTMLNQTDLLGKKWDQVTGSIGKYGEAVKTQAATPQAQFKVALANLEKAGVLLGNQLLPIAIQFAHALTGLASGFNGLSSGAKHFAAEVGIGLLVLGPMLSLTSRVARGITVMSGAMGRFGSATKFAGVALAGAAIGVAIGSMTRNASGAAKAVGALTSTLAGAAVGFQVGGPLGAAVGGLTGLLGDLGSAFGFGSDGAAAKAAELQAKTDDLTQALLSNQDAVNKTNRAWVGSQIAQGGILGQLGKLGLSYTTVTQAIMGNKGAIDEVKAAWTDPAMKHGGPNFVDQAIIGPKAKAAVQNILDLANAYGRANRQLDRIRADRASTKNLFDASRAASLRSADAVSRLAADSMDAARATKSVSMGMDGDSVSAKRLADYLQNLTTKYQKLTDTELSQTQSQLAFKQGLLGLKQQVKDYGTSLSDATVKGVQNRQNLVSILQTSQQAAEGSKNYGKTLLAQVKAFRAHATAVGYSKTAVDNLLRSEKLLPSQIRQRLHLDTSPAQQALTAIMNQINRMHPLIHVGITGGSTTPGHYIPPGVTPARGGFISGPGTSTSDSIPARLSNGEFVVNAAQTAKHRSLLHSINRGAQGFAAGGMAGNPITTGSSDGHKVWIYKGIRYSSLSAAQNAETRDSQSKTKKYRLTGAPGLGGSTYSTRHAADRALAKAVATLERVLGKMSRHDLPNLTRALGKTGSDVKSAVGAWLTDAKQLGLGTAQRRSVAAEGRHVAELVNRRNREQARLQKSIASRAAEKHTVAAAGRGVFDITQAGTNATGAGVSFGALNAQALQSKHLVHKWAAGIRKLGKEGFNKSPTGLAMLRHLAEGGPADWPQVQALLSATPKQLAGLLSTERSIDKASSALGGYVGTQLYGDKIAHERTVVHKDIQDLKSAALKLERRMEKFMDHPIELTVNLDGKKVATGVAKGAARNGRRN